MRTPGRVATRHTTLSVAFGGFSTPIVPSTTSVDFPIYPSEMKQLSFILATPADWHDFCAITPGRACCRAFMCPKTRNSSTKETRWLLCVRSRSTVWGIRPAQVHPQVKEQRMFEGSITALVMPFAGDRAYAIARHFVGLTTHIAPQPFGQIPGLTI